MIRTDQPLFLVSTASHGGKGGQPNEDRFRVESFYVDETRTRASCFAIVADGVGTTRAGQVAAELTADAISTFIEQSDASQPTGILQAAIYHANRLVLQRAESRSEWRGMGSTCLAAWLLGDRLYAASIGSSRLYLLRGRHLRLLNNLRPLPGDAPTEPPSKLRRVKEEDPLRGYLGSKTQVEIDLELNWDLQHSASKGVRLQPNDRVLLCSDGLGDALTEKEVVEILGEHPAYEAAEALVDFALQKGTAHNLTAVVIAMPPGRPPLAPAPFNWRRTFTTALLFMALVAFGLLVWYAWLTNLQVISPPTPTAIHTLTPIPTNTPIQ